MAEALAADLRGYATGKWHDETGWPDVALHACKILNAAEKVVFLTASEIAEAPVYVKQAKDSGGPSGRRGCPARVRGDKPNPRRWGKAHVHP